MEVHVVNDKPMIIAYVILFTGIGLLAFTFISAYIFLINNPSITESSDLADVFGNSLAPLIGASIRIMYLGVMGWIGSGLTTRGVQLVTHLKRLERPELSSRTPPTVKPNEPVRAEETKKTDKA
jgi:energy-coupling factor transporter transmembrane protein EcfT